MTPLYVTLCPEGTSDRMLLPIIRWTLRQHLGPGAPINDRIVTRSGSLTQKIEAALRESGQCDLLIVHRDADKAGVPARVVEIDAAVQELASGSVDMPSHLHVVPVRESEAWLLFDPTAISKAAARERGTAKLPLPSAKHDEVADPKQVLRAALDIASELTGL